MQNNLRFAARVFVLASGISVAVSSSAVEKDVTRLSAGTCSSLQGLSIPASAIGLPNSGATVETAIAIGVADKGNANGDFCKVTGVVKPAHAGSPNLEFEVNLPFAWNRRALQMGGGGYDGSLVTALTVYSNQPPDAETPLKQGLSRSEATAVTRALRVSTALSEWTTKHC